MCVPNVNVEIAGRNNNLTNHLVIQNRGVHIVQHRCEWREMTRKFYIINLFLWPAKARNKQQKNNIIDRQKDTRAWLLFSLVVLLLLLLCIIIIITYYFVQRLSHIRSIFGCGVGK